MLIVKELGREGGSKRERGLSDQDNIISVHSSTDLIFYLTRVSGNICSFPQ